MKEDDVAIKIAVRQCNLNYSPPTLHDNTNSTTSINKEDFLQFHLNTQYEEPAPITRQMTQYNLLIIPGIELVQPKFRTTSLIIIERKKYNASCHKQY